MNTIMPMAKVSVIILNWNGLQETSECLESLQKINYHDYRVIVVDNGSRIDEARILRQTFGDYIEVIEHGKNLGYARGMNTGINYARDKYHPDYFLLLNNDTTQDPEFLDRLLIALEAYPGAGIAGPKVYYYDKPRIIQHIGANVNMYTGAASYYGLMQEDTGQYDEVREVDWVAPCVLLKSDVIEKTGGFDDSFFAYWEDADLCIRAKHEGYTTIYVPDSRIWHKLGAATGNLSERMYYFTARNLVWFMRKNATAFQYRCFVMYLTGYNIWAISAYLMIKDRKPMLKGFWRGVRDGLKNEKKYACYYT